MKESKPLFFIFDLDDTLYREIDFLSSGFQQILKRHPKANRREELFNQMIQLYHSGKDAFEWLKVEFARENIPGEKDEFLKEYRNHFPNISLDEEVFNFLNKLKTKKIPSGLITDGRSITQRNKIKALGIEEFFIDIIISQEFGSEKPHAKNYLFFEEKYPGNEFCYIADNTNKDFIVPKQLGWKIYCLKDQGFNIHKQILEGFDKSEIIDSFKEIEL